MIQTYKRMHNQVIKFIGQKKSSQNDYPFFVDFDYALEKKSINALWTKSILPMKMR